MKNKDMPFMSFILMLTDKIIWWPLNLPKNINKHIRLLALIFMIFYLPVIILIGGIPYMILAMLSMIAELVYENYKDN